MPTIQRRSREARLADLLARRLQSGNADPQPPFIMDDALAGGHGRHLVVLWDQWANMEPSKRARIILDAFERAYPGQSATVTLAIGLSLSEALSLGYLPYKVEPAVRNGDKVSTARLRQALESVGGAVIKIGESTQLRFPTLDHAQQAYRALQQRVPGPFWTIVQEVSSAESA